MQDNFVDPCNIAEVTIINYVDLYYKGHEQNWLLWEVMKTTIMEGDN